ncbi:hypothetical protein L917_01078, partial [Phytophthora nicotianae]
FSQNFDAGVIFLPLHSLSSRLAYVFTLWSDLEQLLQYIGESSLMYSE